MHKRNPFFAFFETFSIIFSWKIIILIDFSLYDRDWNELSTQGSAAERET